MIFEEKLKKGTVLFVLFFLSISLFAQEDKQTFNQYSKKEIERFYKRGKKIYENICSKIELEKYNNFEELKTTIKKENLCSNQKEKNIEAISVYLWQVKLFGKDTKLNSKMDVPKGAKCPVCGMFVHKYPKWATKMDIGKHTHYFDGVKDMMKFYFYPNSFGHVHKKSEIKDIKVRDYYTLTQIDAKKAWYVIGSNVYGPMGHELIPFKSEKEAKTFLKNHYGKRVLSFEEITENIVFELDK